MTGNAPYRTLRLGRSGKVALVDIEDYLRLSRHKWHLGGSGYPLRCRTIAGRPHRITLQREVLREPQGMIRFINGNPLDCRRDNLRLHDGGSVSFDRKSKRRPYRVRIDLDGEVYFVGGWPQRAWAEEVRKIVAATAAELRGRGLTRKQVQRRLDLATGRRVLRAPVKVQQERARAA